jgi:hypothetical protein
MRYFTVLIFAVASAIAQQSAHGAPGSSTASRDRSTALLTYEPSELQKLRLENAQLKLVVVALQIQPLEQKRQEQLAALSELCQAIVKENHWPDNVKCDPATLKFKESQPGAASALDPKADRQPVPAQPASSTDPRQ